MGTVLLSFLITTALVFTSLFFLFKKYKPSKNTLNNSSYWVIAIFSTPVFYIGFLYVSFLFSSQFEKQEFTKDNWVKNYNTRYVYVDDLIDGNKLIGLTCNELKSMLGDTDYEDDYIMTFYIGYSPGTFLNMDPDWLETELVQGKVSRVSTRE